MLRAFVAGLALVGVLRNRQPHRLSRAMSWPDVPSSAVLSKRSYGACLPSTHDLMRQEAISRSKGRGKPDRLLVPTAELDEPDGHPQP